MMGGENDVRPAGLEQQRRERCHEELKERAIRFICSLTEGIIDYKSQQQYTSRLVKKKE